MEPNDIDKIKIRANNEVVRRLLIRYFMNKGFTESFDLQLNPLLLQDMLIQIPELSSKVEIVPYMEELDNMQSKATIGWNLFVLGNQRMYLGETYHNNLKDLARQIHEGQILIPEDNASTYRLSTPRRVIHFIMRSLTNKKGAYVDLLTPSTDSYIGRMTNHISNAQPDLFKRKGYGV